MVLIDKHVLIDVIAEDPVWCEWSLAQLRLAKASRAFMRYRIAKGTRTGVLPDLFHWRPCRSGKLGIVDTRPDALPPLFSESLPDLPLRSRSA